MTYRSYVSCSSPGYVSQEECIAPAADSSREMLYSLGDMWEMRDSPAYQHPQIMKDGLRDLMYTSPIHALPYHASSPGFVIQAPPPPNPGINFAPRISGHLGGALTLPAFPGCWVSAPRREFRGYCRYKTGKCRNERAIKGNGKAHNLCEFHRTKQNSYQKKLDVKNRLKKRSAKLNLLDGRSEAICPKRRIGDSLKPLQTLVKPEAGSVSSSHSSLGSVSDSKNFQRSSGDDGAGLHLMKSSPTDENRMLAEDDEDEGSVWNANESEGSIAATSQISQDQQDHDHARSHSKSVFRPSIPENVSPRVKDEKVSPMQLGSCLPNLQFRNVAVSLGTESRENNVNTQQRLLRQGNSPDGSKWKQADIDMLLNVLKDSGGTPVHSRRD